MYNYGTGNNYNCGGYQHGYGFGYGYGYGSAAGYQPYGGHCGGRRGGCAFILVLFILLIIIGACGMCC